MRVNIDRTVEVSDEERKLIASSLGQKAVTRAEIQEFIWARGADWRQAITPAVDGGAVVGDEDLIEFKAPTFDPSDLL